MQRNIISSKTCKYCVNAKSTMINQDYICSKHGIVDENYRCRNFVYNSNTLKTCNRCEYFNESSDHKLNQGCCTLFSRRTFDGSKKQSCKLFSAKSKLYTESTG